MSAEIFCAGMDRKVDAEIERAKIQRARPGIIHDHHRALGMRRRGDGGHVLHLETQRARRFEEDRAGIRLHELRDPTGDEGIVVGRGDTEPSEDLVAKNARRCVGAVGNENMVAGVDDRQQRSRNSGKSGGQQRDAVALRPLKLLHGEFERLGRRRTAPAVLIARAVRQVILGAWVEHGRGMIDRRVDETVIGRRIAAGRDNARIRASRFSAFAVLILGHRFLCTSPGARRAPIM